MQTKRLHILLALILINLIGINTNAQKTKHTTTAPKGTNINNSKNDAVKDIISHTAQDYILEDVVKSKVSLHNKAHLIYGEYDIQAGHIDIDYKRNQVKAKGIADEKGKYAQQPIFKTATNETTQDSIIFNFKSKKAVIYGLETNQDGINTLGEKTKRVNDSTIFVRNIIFTTSEPRNPDYYLRTNKAKIIPGKKIITGSTNLVIADVPTPLIFPFAYFPLTKSRTSGFVIPTYGESQNQGFFLQNGGYYFALNDYWDLKLTGDIYSNSSWGINIDSKYNVRYQYNGNLSFNYDNLITGLPGFSTYSKSKNFNLRWSHTQDSKANPNSNFSSSVNLGSSQYFRNSINESNGPMSLTNTLASSISYYKKFVGTPFNMNISANHSQNTNTQSITLNLPSIQINMDRQYPFAPKTGLKKNALQNIGINYSFRAENRINTTESEFLTPAMYDDAKNGIQHNISMNTNMKAFKYFSLAPSVNYREIWYFEGINKVYNPTTTNITTNTNSGFESFRDYNFSTSLSTTAYGMFKVNGKTLQTIRHTIRPSLSYSYRPDFGFYYEKVQETADATKFQTYSRFDGGIYGSPSRGITNAIGINLANNFEAKVKDKKNIEGNSKKINLLNSLNLSSQYNFAADSLKLSPINLTTGTQLFKKLNINFGSSFDAYALNTKNQRINTFSIQNGGPLVRLTRANFTVNYALSSNDFKTKKSPQQKTDNTNVYDQNFFGESIRKTNDFANNIDDPTNSTKKDKEADKIEFYKNGMPWTLRLAYSTNYENSIGQNEFSSSSLMMSGDIELSPGWSVGASSGYDFINKGTTYTQFRFNRDLKSWSMNFNWIPLSDNSSYYFFIGVKAAVLSDLKWDKRSVNRQF